MNSQVRRLWNQRYLSKDDFKRLAEGVNLRVGFDDELEYYERHGHLTPRVRLVKPVDVVEMETRRRRDVPRDYMPPLSYRELKYTARSPGQWATCSDEDLADPLDRFENDLIERPWLRNNESLPWSHYEVEIKSGERTSRETRQEIYYAPWQVLQLRLIHDAANYWARGQLQSLVRSWPPRGSLYLPPEDAEPLARLSVFFDGISYFRSLVETAALRAHYVREARLQRVLPLDARRTQRMTKRLANAAAQRAGLDPASLVDLIGLCCGYAEGLQKTERATLLALVEHDISWAIDWINVLTGWDLPEIQRRVSFPWLERRHPQFALRQEAERAIGWYTQNIDPPDGPGAATAHELVSYLWDNGMLDVLHAIDFAAFPPEQANLLPFDLDMALRLRMLTVGLEQFAKAVWLGDKLPRTMRPLMHAYSGEFAKPKEDDLFAEQAHLTSADDDVRFRTNLRKLMTSKSLKKHPQVRSALVSTLARNVVVHRRIAASIAFTEDFSACFREVMHCYIYVWRHANGLQATQTAVTPPPSGSAAVLRGS